MNFESFFFMYILQLIYTWYGSYLNFLITCLMIINNLKLVFIWQITFFFSTFVMALYWNLIVVVVQENLRFAYMYYYFESVNKYE